MSDFAHKQIFLLNSTMNVFLKTDIICVNQFGISFHAVSGFDLYGSGFLLFSANTRYISMCN